MVLALVDILFWMVCIAMATIGTSCIIVGVYYCVRAARVVTLPLDNQQ